MQTDEKVFMDNEPGDIDWSELSSCEGLLSCEPSQEVKKMPKVYQSVLPYEKMADRVRNVWIPATPEHMHGMLGDLIEAFELAAEKVQDRDSERSHLANIMHCGCDVDFNMAGAGLDQKATQLLLEFDGPLADAYEVLEWGDSADDKPDLPLRFDLP